MLPCFPNDKALVEFLKTKPFVKAKQPPPREKQWRITLKYPELSSWGTNYIWETKAALKN